MHRLHVRIYLTTLLSLVVLLVATGLLWSLIMERSMATEHDGLIGAMVSRALPPVDATPEVASAILGRDLMSPVGGLELRDANGVTQGHAGSLPRQNGDERGLRRIELRDGRLLLVEVRRGPLLLSHLHGLIVIIWIALVVAIATYPLARRLTRRLEALAATVDRFGEGDLSVRAPIAGQDEVAALAQRFNRMADRVAQLLKAHSRMLANASHELRSPLARMRMALELHGSTPTQAWLESMQRDCAEIDQQIEEILLASKLETTSTFPPPEPLDLAALLAEECSRLNIPFELVPAPLRGNPRLLRRLIRNLLDNAIKYGGSEVEARLLIAANGDRILQISDRGPGIAPEERERIFEPFYRPAGAAETGNGWGLGLSLVKQIAEHHGGRVECRERAGGGCVFEASFPTS